MRYSGLKKIVCFMFLSKKNIPWVGRLFFSNIACFMAAVVVILCSNPVFMLIGDGRAERN